VSDLDRIKALVNELESCAEFKVKNQLLVEAGWSSLVMYNVVCNKQKQKRAELLAAIEEAVNKK